jgi:hypothetical protein
MEIISCLKEISIKGLRNDLIQKLYCYSDNKLALFIKSNNICIDNLVPQPCYYFDNYAAIVQSLYQAGLHNTCAVLYLQFIPWYQSRLTFSMFSEWYTGKIIKFINAIKNDIAYHDIYYCLLCPCQYYGDDFIKLILTTINVDIACCLKLLDYAIRPRYTKIDTAITDYLSNLRFITSKRYIWISACIPNKVVHNNNVRNKNVRNKKSRKNNAT